MQCIAANQTSPLGLQESSLSNVFFVAADLDKGVLEELVTCMNQHSNFQLLGQKAPKKVEKGAYQPEYHFLIQS